MRLVAKIHKINSDEKSNVKATASVALGGQFAVHDITVMNGKNGLFVKMPSRKFNDEYRDYFHPIQKEARMQLNKVVLDEYHRVLSQMQTSDNEPVKSEKMTDQESENESEESDFEEITYDQEMNM